MEAKGVLEAEVTAEAAAVGMVEVVAHVISSRWPISIVPRKGGDVCGMHRNENETKSTTVK